VDIDAIRRDRDQLWAEAHVRYKAGERWWPDAELSALCTQEQNERVIPDPWVDIVGKWLEDPFMLTVDPVGRRTRDKFDISQGVLTHEVLQHALEKRPGDITRADEMRVAEVLRELGWEPSKQAREGGRRIRRYTPASKTASAA